MFRAPIPGQSLTTPPKQFPYERPPEIVDPEEALQYHLSRLGDDKRKSAVLDMLELDVDIVTLTEGILRNGVAEGLHTIDVSLMIAPVVHKFIKKLADDSGVEYNEGLEDKKAEASYKESMEKAKAIKKVNKRMKTEAEPSEVEAEVEPVEEAPVEMSTEPESQGLVPRRNV